MRWVDHLCRLWLEHQNTSCTRWQQAAVVPSDSSLCSHNTSCLCYYFCELFQKHGQSPWSRLCYICLFKFVIITLHYITLPSWLIYLAYFLRSHITYHITRLRFARDLWRFTNVIWLIDWSVIIVLAFVSCSALFYCHYIYVRASCLFQFEWMNERTNERVNEWMNEWMNGWMNGWMHRVTRRLRNSANAANSTKFLWLALSTCYNQHRDSDHHQNLVIYCKSHMP